MNKSRPKGLHLSLFQQDNVFFLRKAERSPPDLSPAGQLNRSADCHSFKGSRGQRPTPDFFRCSQEAAGWAVRARRPRGHRRAKPAVTLRAALLVRPPGFLASLPGPGKRRKEQPKCTTSVPAGKPPPPPPPPAFPRQGHHLPGFFGRCHRPPLRPAEGQAAPSFQAATLRRPHPLQRRPRGLPLLLALPLLPAGQSGPASSHPPPYVYTRGPPLQSRAGDT